MQPVSIPEGARFSCQSCGRCCQGWVVPVDQATVDRLRAHDWGADPFEPNPGASEPYRTKLVNGRCFFLDKENRCRIHTEISYDAKPPVCRAFPLAVLDVAGKRYARLSYWCPTVAANTGKPLDQQSRWLKDTAKHTDRRTKPLMINQNTEIPARDFERVHLSLRQFLMTTSLPLSDRMAAASALVRRLDRAAEEGDSASVARVIETAESEGAFVLAQEARHGGDPAGGRRALSLYLLQDKQPGRFFTLVRFLSVLLFNAGVTQIRSRAVSCRASWRQIRRVAFDLSAESNEFATRYLSSKLDSRRYVAGEMTLVTGFNLLLAAYGMINVLARMRAVAHGRLVCEDEDIRLALSAADLLVVEHAGFEGRKLLTSLTQSALGSSSLCGDLFAHLEGKR